MSVEDQLNAADEALMNIETDRESLESAIAAARSAINSARALVREGVEATAN